MGWLSSTADRRIGATKEGPLAVDCWGRKYTFDNASFPTQVTTGHRPLLVAPIRLSAVLDSQPMELQANPLRVARHAPTDVVLEGSTAHASLQTEVKATLEYDGMLRLDCTLTPKRDVMLNQLFLEIPLAPDQATLYHYWPGHWGTRRKLGGLAGKRFDVALQAARVAGQ